MAVRLAGSSGYLADDPAHDAAAGSNPPVPIGYNALNFGANPTSVAAGDRTGEHSCKLRCGKTSPQGNRAHHRGARGPARPRRHESSSRAPQGLGTKFCKQKICKRSRGE